MKKYIINDKKKIIFLKNNEILFENNETFRIKLSNEDYKELFNICKKYIIFSEDRCSKNLFNILKKNKLIISANEIIISSYGTRYERNELFALNFFKNKNFNSLKNKKILFIGTGGIASIIIDHLISVGIKKYSIIDFDNVDNSNLNRQFVYNENDVGKNKVEIFEKYIYNKNKDSEVKKYNLMIENIEQLDKIVKNDNIDFIINSADMPPYYLQKIIVSSSINNNIPCIFGGVGIDEGSYGPLLSNRLSKYKYLKDLNKILNNIEYIFPCKSSFGVTNSLIATYMSWDIIMFLLDETKHVKSLNKTISVNF